MALSTNPENFRAEMARHRLTREAICRPIKMHENLLSMFLNGVRPLPDWAAHNIGWSFNTVTQQMIFGVDMETGPVEAPQGRRRGRGVRLDTGPRKRQRRRRPSYF